MLSSLLSLSQRILMPMLTGNVATAAMVIIWRYRLWQNYTIEQLKFTNTAQVWPCHSFCVV